MLNGLGPDWRRQAIRRPTPHESALIRLLAAHSRVPIPADEVASILVRPIPDYYGDPTLELGSLDVLSAGRRGRGGPRMVADSEYADLDGFTVLVSLHVDNAGRLFEMFFAKLDDGTAVVLDLPPLLPNGVPEVTIQARRAAPSASDDTSAR